MTKQLACGDVVPGCTYVATASNEMELMQKVAKHAADAHNVQEITPELLAKVKAAVKETP